MVRKSNASSFPSPFNFRHYRHKRNQEHAASPAFSFLTLNMEEHIVIILYKVAKQLLLLFCLTQTHIKCDTESQYRSFALIEYDTKQYQDDKMLTTHDVHAECGAVWISGKSVLTAASCFDKKLNHPKEKTLKVISTQRVTEEPYIPYILDGKQKLDGYKVIKHPWYERRNDMTIGFDLAVMKVERPDDHPHIAKLCTKITTSDWVVFAKYTRDEMDDLVWESSVDAAHLPKNHAIAQSEKNKATRYFIDPEEQFTIELKEPNRNPDFVNLVGSGGQKTMDADNFFGGPVMQSGWSGDGCVVGIMNFGAVENGIRYITSTNVTPVIPWIDWVEKNDSPYPGMKKKTKKAKSSKQGTPGNLVYPVIKPVIKTEQRKQDTTHKPHKRATAKTTTKQITKNDIGSPYNLRTTFPKVYSSEDFNPFKHR